MKEKVFLRILLLVRPYWKWLVGAVFFAVVFALCSGATIAMLLPVFDEIFARTGEEHQDSDLIPLLRENVQPELDSLATSLVSFRIGDAVAHAGAIGKGINNSLGAADPVQALFAIILTMVFLICLKNASAYMQVFFLSHLEEGVLYDLRNLLYSHILSLDLGYFASCRSGEINSRLTADVLRLRGAISQALIHMIKQTVLLCVFMAIALWASWKLALVTLGVLPPSMLIIILLGRRLRKKSHRAQERMADFASIISETVFGVRVVKAFAMEKFEESKFLRVLGLHRRSEISLRRLHALSGPLTEILGAVASGVILWFGGRAVLSGDGISAGRFFVFLAAALSMMDPIKSISKANAGIQAGLAAAERVFRLVDRKPAILDPEHPVPFGSFEMEIEFHDVCFSYVPGEQVLTNVNLRVPRGEILALVGPSGGGKSTLVDMVPRFYDPDSGRILIDGIDLRDIPLSDLRRNMGIVTQETVLFNDTVRNNIAYGEDSIPLEKVREAAEAANALEFVNNLPMGFDTVIGERGLTLSGGQRQRLAIARAVLKDPPILIFDEATSSLDSHSEQLVQKAIDSLMSGRTAFVIAHRLSTVRKAHRIVFIENGQIVEEGTHDELLSLGGRYRRLYELQFAENA